MQAQSTQPAYPTWPQPQPSRATGIGLRLAILILGAGSCAYMAMQINQLSRYAAFLPTDENVLGNAGMVVILWIIGLAAVWGAPVVAAGAFGLAGMAAIHMGVTGLYGDMRVWGALAFVLAGLSLIDWRQRHDHVLSVWLIRGGNRVVAIAGGVTLIAIVVYLMGGSVAFAIAGALVVPAIIVHLTER